MTTREQGAYTSSMYIGHVGNFGYNLGSTGLGDDGLGFFFPGMDQLIGKVMGGGEKKEEPKKATPSFTFCPPGQIPNPQWAAIPEEGRAQAAAAGIQACLPDPSKAKGKPKCMFIFGASKYKCNQGDFQRAYSRARKSAAKKPTGKSSVRLQIGSQTIIIPVRSGGAAAAPGAAAPGMPGYPGYPGYPPQLAQRDPTTGAFQCVPGFKVMQDPQGRVVCVDPAQMAQQQTPAARSASARGESFRSRRHRGSARGRGRGRGRLRDGLGHIWYPSDSQLYAWRQTQYAQALAREPYAAQYTQAVAPTWPTPSGRLANLAMRLPPSGMSLADAFGAF